MKLNLGCGTSKIDGYVNVDIDPQCDPDEVFDFRLKLPYEDNSIEKIVMYHVIEHIEKKYHYDMLKEIHRVLQPEGELVLAFPEFTKVVQNWKDNKRGMRDFWEATIYGRQASPSDFHVSLMDTDQLSIHLVRHGFSILSTHSEPGQDFNTVIKCSKVECVTYEKVLRDVIEF